MSTEYRVSDIEGLSPVMAPAADRRERIRTQVVASVQKLFPVEATNFIVEASDVRIEPRAFKAADVKRAFMAQESLTEPVKATITLRNKRTGEVVEQKRATLGHVPYLTNEHTFMVDGNRYALSNQLRVRPGTYTRYRSNGEIETQFNTGRGLNFKVFMDPAAGIFYLQYAQSKTPVYPLLTAMGVTHEAVAKAWGDDVARLNQQKVGDKQDQAIKAIATRVAPRGFELSGKSRQELAQMIQEVWRKSNLSADITEKTLGTAFEVVTPEAILSAGRKILRVYNQEEPEDDRDDLANQTLHTPDTYFKERIEKDAAKALVPRWKLKLNHTSTPTLQNLGISGSLTSPLRSLLTGSALAQSPTQINPVEIIDGSVKVTRLGEGGIGDTRAVPESTREQHDSHLGVLDYVRTPESETVGIDVRASVYSAVDAHGKMHGVFINPRTKKAEYVPVSKLRTSKIAFSDADLTKPTVPALVGDAVREVKSSEVDYVVPAPIATFSPASAFVPMPGMNQGNRSVMGAKQATQAVPLVNRQVPWVQCDLGDGTSAEDKFAKWHLPVSPVDGKVTKIDRKTTTIVVTDKDGKEHEVDFADNYPLASKTRLHHDLTVKVGDSVKKDQVMGDSNFTRGGTMALGTNLRTAYLAYHGLNSNDAVVISQSAAEHDLVSEHAYRESLWIGPDTTLSRAIHQKHFGARYSPAQYERLDEHGVIKEGQKVRKGELLVAAVVKRQPTADDILLGRLGRQLASPYKDAALVWDHGHEGTVTDVTRTPTGVAVLVMTREGMTVGDKLAGRVGNKGVVSAIIPDNLMPRDAQGRPVQLLITSASVVSRINPSQVIERAAAKVAEKTGKPLVGPAFNGVNGAKWARDLQKQHGVEDKETVFDPVTGREIPGVAVGPLYVYKLFKSTETNFASRGVGAGYDQNEQPTKGGVAGAKSLGRMDAMALVAHGARGVLQSSATIKSQANDEYWKNLQLGLPPGPPRPSFAYKKFESMIEGSGVRLAKEGSKIRLLPLTDADVDRMADHEIDNGGVVKVKATKDGVRLEPEKGGLFDPVKTGGMRGTRWAKITLAEPTINPIFETAAKRVLDMDTKTFDDLLYNQGGQALKDRLNAVDLRALEQSLTAQIKADVDRKPEAHIDKLAKRLAAVRALLSGGHKAGDAYVITRVPVVPPVMRALVQGQGGTLLVSDPNFLYRDLLLVNDGIKSQPPELRQATGEAAGRKNLQAAVKALVGAGDPVNDKTKARQVQGFLSNLAGVRTPKEGFVQARLIKRRQDLSGRGTIAPDPNLGIDEIGIPEEMLWTQMQPFIMRRLVTRGYDALTAEKMIKERHPTAHEEMVNETKTRPVMFNRAPTLHRWNLVSAWAKPVPGKTIMISPFYEQLANADYDGDAIQVHVPVTDHEVADARRMVISNLALSDGSKNSVIAAPQHEAIIGAFLATQPATTKAPKRYPNKAAAMKAYYNNEIAINDPITVDNQTDNVISPIPVAITARHRGPAHH